MDDFPTLQQSITSSLVSATRTASQLAAADLQFHRSLNSSLSASLDQQNARLLTLAERLLGSANQTADSVRPSPGSLSDIEAVEGNWRAVVDVLDSLLERADTALDEFTGAVRRLSPGAAEQAGKQAERAGAARPGRIAASLRNQEIEKPQLKFEHVPRNDEVGIFVPLLEGKPHAKRSLADRQQGEHPYQREIEEYAYPEEVHTQAEPIMYHPFDMTTATLVDTEEAMYDMLDELKQAKELAIDLEHHDQRTYIGVVSLMQISTRDKDWIVDTLKPWRRKLSCLNEVFADPSIIKVLHGAYMDVVWLQRDLGLYLVGLFDTHYACRALGYPGGSLAYLLKRFANVDAQKQYQTADWRIRPLPQELFDYARSDTHYLLYIFDNLRNELLQRSDFSMPDREGDKLFDVLQRSSETALQVYEHPVYDSALGQGPVGWYKLLARTPALLNKEQFAVFRAVHKWRDDVAREQDDSTHFVMPNHHIFSIAKAVPISKPDVFNAAHPATQSMRLRIDELVAVIQKAQKGAPNGLEMMDVLQKIEPHFPRRGVAKEAAASAHSVAAFVPKSTPAVDGAKSVIGASALPLRSATSTFWGSSMPPATQQQSRALSSAPVISLSIPLPPLTADIFGDPSEKVSTPILVTEPAAMEVSPAAEPQEDETFVLKQLGKERKRPVADSSITVGMVDGMAANNDEVALTQDDQELDLLGKSARHRARKEAKRAAKLAAASGMDADDLEPGGVQLNGHNRDDEVFDYASAPSMLNPPRESREEMRERRKKVVDPYKKSSDVPKPLGRVQRERAGRSMTYKS
ncbi:exosome nuclease subunit [Recurvomyces mirabilis]|nr:exosome nuclease subunit [Recurvomyces mirabilis]